MNNWDKKPELIVVYGEDIPHHLLEEVATQHLQLNREVLIQVNIGTVMEDNLVFDVSDMYLPHIRDVMDCLNDHIEQTKPEEWLVAHSDYALNSSDLYHPEEDELWVSIGSGVYFGQNCKVTVYNITI